MLIHSKIFHYLPDTVLHAVDTAVSEFLLSCSLHSRWIFSICSLGCFYNFLPPNDYTFIRT